MCTAHLFTWRHDSEVQGIFTHKSHTTYVTCGWRMWLWWKRMCVERSRNVHAVDKEVIKSVERFDQDITSSCRLFIRQWRVNEFKNFFTYYQVAQPRASEILGWKLRRPDALTTLIYDNDVGIYLEEKWRWITASHQTKKEVYNEVYLLQEE